MGSPLWSIQLFTIITMPYKISMWFFIALCLQATLATPMGGGKCETTADCVAPNVCSKWGWCQWTKIYGEDGPSQGASAPAGGRAGQCKTSADCASRVPYCSKLGFCHGGRLPFDEAQLEIVGDEEAQGFINNNPPKNSPILKKSKSSNNGGAASRKNGGNARKNGGNGRKNAGNGRKNAGSTRKNNESQARKQSSNRKTSTSGSDRTKECPGGSVDACIDQACVPLDNVTIYAACAKGCGKRCPNK